MKMTKFNLKSLINIDMLLMVGKGIRVVICHSVLRYAKANNTYMKNYNQNKDSLYLTCLDKSNLYGQPMSHCSLIGFRCV